MKRIKFLSMLLALTAMSLTACHNDPPSGEEEDPGDGPVDTGSAECGNGIWEKGEQCDGKLGMTGVTCKSVTKQDVEGTVKCTACKYDASDCKGNPVLAANYEATFHYDLSGIVPQEYDQVTTFLQGPAQFLSNWAVTKLIEMGDNEFGTNPAWSIAKVALTPVVQEKITSIINTYVASEETQAKLLPAANAMTSFKTAISDFTVVSTMKVKAGADGTSHSVEESWDSIAFNWTYNCTADCVQKIAVKEMGLTNESNLTAKYGMDFFAEQEQAGFENRNFSMEYGAIIMYVYQNKLVPAITGVANAKGSGGLIKWIVDTDNLATRICTSDNDNSDTTWAPLEDYSWLAFEKATVKQALDGVADYAG